MYKLFERKINGNKFYLSSKPHSITKSMPDLIFKKLFTDNSEESRISLLEKK